MTYGELLDKLYQLGPLQLQQDVTIYLREKDEYLPAKQTARATDENDVLDTLHFVIVV